MEVKNIIGLNDNGLRRYIIIVSVFQLAIFCLLWLNSMGLKVPFIWQIVGFIYLTILPGIGILRILKITKINLAEFILYTIGLSLSLLMIMGLFMNMVYPSLGIPKPFSQMTVIITIFAITTTLCILNIIVGGKNFDIMWTHIKITPIYLLSYSLPILSVLGTILVNFWHNNILLMLLIILIAIIFLAYSYSNSIDASHIVLSLIFTSVSLIWTHTLISSNLSTGDVIKEYYLTNLVIRDSYWNYTNSYTYNSALPIVVLAPIYSYACNIIDSAWIYKVIFPLIYSFVPIGLYIFYTKEYSSKVAYLASFFFLSFYASFTIIPDTNKQAISELFFVLILLIFFNKDINEVSKRILLIIFSSSLAISHYGTSYLVMFSLIFAGLFIAISDSNIVEYALNTLQSKVIRSPNVVIRKIPNHDNISLAFITFFCVFIFAWFIFISNSTIFVGLVGIGDHIRSTIADEFLSPESSRGAYYIAKEMVSPLHQAYKIFQISMQGFILIGFIGALLGRYNFLFKKLNLGFSLYWLSICILGILVSGFAAMNPARLYQISLFILSPFAILGMNTVLSLVPQSLIEIKINNKHIIISCILVVFFLFNTGFIFEVLNDHPDSLALSQEKIKKYGDITDKGSYYSQIILDQEVSSAKWLSRVGHFNDKTVIYATIGHGEGRAAIGGYGMIPFEKVKMLDNTTSILKPNSYIYLSYANLIDGIGLGLKQKIGTVTFFNFSEVKPILIGTNKIYENGGSEINSN